MANVSPGVFTKIIDLSTFVQVVPSTIGFLCGYSNKGRDNELIFVGSRADYISEWGEPNIQDFGKNYGQGPYIAYNHLGESGALYWMRLLPDDATYSNLRLDAKLAAVDATASITITYVDSLNTYDEIETIYLGGESEEEEEEEDNKKSSKKKYSKKKKPHKNYYHSLILLGLVFPQDFLVAVK